MKNFIFIAILAVAFCGCEDKAVDFKSACDKEDKECLIKECDSGNGAGCYLAGEKYGVKEPTDPRISYYKKSCDLNYAAGCEALGYIYAWALKYDYLAEKYLKKSCDLKNGEGCDNLADFYKDKKDYKKAVKYYKIACDELKYGAGCGSLADFYKEEQDNYKEAIKYYKIACDELKYGNGCSGLGEMYDDGKGVEKDTAKAMSYFQKGCEYEERGYGCKIAAEYIVEEADKHAFYQKACEKAEKYAEKYKAEAVVDFICTPIGRYYYYDKGNYTQAKIYLEKACAFGYGCVNLGKLYYDGEGMSKNQAQAKIYFDKALSGKNIGHKCEEIGDFLKDKNTKEAMIYYEKGCMSEEYSVDTNCRKLANIYFDKGDANKGSLYLKKSCDKSEFNPWFMKNSCEVLGNYYIDKKDFDEAFGYYKKLDLEEYDYYALAKPFIKAKQYDKAKYFLRKICEKYNCFDEAYKSSENKEYAKARLIYEILCDEKNDNATAAACNNLGNLYNGGRGVARNAAKAFYYYKKSCDAGSSKIACNNLGYRYYNGDGTKKDYAKAKEVWQKSCDNGSADSCASLGFLHENGQGVRQNFKTAKEFYGKGCDMGSQKGCDGYRRLNGRGW